MASIPVSVVLGVTDKFSADMMRAIAATQSLRGELALFDATWEPHDWSTF